MTLVRWHLFQDPVAMRGRDDRAIDSSYTPGPEDSLEAWAPPVDIFEKEDSLVIRAEIPGVRTEDMDVRIENGVLTVRGERKHEAAAVVANAYRMERVHGAFRRSFSLPTTVDAAKVTATYKDGILEVTVPKTETAKPKAIEIKAA